MKPTPYATDPADSICDSWVPVGSIMVSRRPLFDTRTGLSSRHTYAEALAAVARLGARLPTCADVDAIRDAGLVLSPFTLPDAKLLADAGVRVSDQAGAQRLREEWMASYDWCKYHDDHVSDALAAAGWQGDVPVMNDGKWYVAGVTRPCLPPKGRAWLKGWWTGTEYIQHGPSSEYDQGPHSDTGSRDYGTLTMAVRL